MSRPTVIKWRDRFAENGIAGLRRRAAHRAGRRRSTTRRSSPRRWSRRRESLAVTHWSTRLLGRHLGVGDATVARAWRKYRVQPWRRETFKFSTDPELEAKVRDVVGLYLNPPENAIVLCVDEKSQIQALDRTAPILPMRPGLPEKAHPRLQAPRHHDAVRGAGGRDREGHRPVLRPARQGRVPRLPQAGRQGLPAPASCTWCWTTTPPTSTPTVKRLAGRRTRGSRCTSPRPPGPG